MNRSDLLDSPERSQGPTLVGLIRWAFAFKVLKGRQNTLEGYFQPRHSFVPSGLTDDGRFFSNPTKVGPCYIASFQEAMPSPSLVSGSAHSRSSGGSKLTNQNCTRTFE